MEKLLKNNIIYYYYNNKYYITIFIVNCANVVLAPTVTNKQANKKKINK